MNPLIKLNARNQAIVVGTIVTVELILEQLKEGLSVEQIAKQFRITVAQVKAAIDFAKTYLPQPGLCEIDYEMLVGVASSLDLYGQDLAQELAYTLSDK